jgi:sugar lactone lactonase YvrE
MTSTLLCTSLLLVLFACFAHTNIPSKNATLLFNNYAILGENAFYDTEKALFFWIDITGKLVNIYDPKTNKNTKFDVPQMIGFLTLTKDGNGLIMGLQGGLAHGNFTYNSQGDITNIVTRMLFPVEKPEKPHNRFNDGKCDPNGVLWAGTMDIDCKGHQGNFYVFPYNKNFKMKKVIPDTTISNGIVWTKDRKTMYWIETGEGTIYAFDYDENQLSISNKRFAWKPPSDCGCAPDGMTIDSHDKLWVAQYNGGRVSRVDPVTHKELFRVYAPLAHETTSCSFGGPNLTDLYITSGCQFMSDEDWNKYPNSGGLFRVDLSEYFRSLGGDVKGTAFTRFGNL